MKSGASDPFADQDDEGEDSEDEPAIDPARSDSDVDSSPAGTTGTETAGMSHSQSDSPDTSSTSGRAAEGAGDDEPLSREQLPFVLRREKVKDERPEVHQLFVQQGTHDRAVEAERELETRLDADLSRTDAREAIYLAGMAHLEDAESILREWGYDL